MHICSSNNIPNIIMLLGFSKCTQILDHEQMRDLSSHSWKRMSEFRVMLFLLPNMPHYCCSGYLNPVRIYTLLGFPSKIQLLILPPLHWLSISWKFTSMFTIASGMLKQLITLLKTRLCMFAFAGCSLAKAVVALRCWETLKSAKTRVPQAHLSC